MTSCPSKEGLLAIEASRVLPGMSKVDVRRETDEADEAPKQKASCVAFDKVYKKKNNHWNFLGHHLIIVTSFR